MAKSWKEHLLRSGVPLEYQVARLLAAEGMSVEADFAFIRRDTSGEKEWSVDISATSYEKNRKGDLISEISMLIECKYRSKGKTLLLIEDPNSEYPNGTLGGTIRAIDHHVPYHVATAPFEAMERNIPTAYKAIEIHEAGAVEQDIRHAIQQLRYSIPLNLRKRIDFGMSINISEALPIYISNIIVTSADLRLLKSGINIEEIEASEDISDISEQYPYIIMHSDYGPDYETHFKSVFSEGHEERMQFGRNVSDRLAWGGKQLRPQESLDRYIEGLSRAERYICYGLSTQFFITTLDGLPKLLKEIRSSCGKSWRSRTKTDSVLRWFRHVEPSKR